MWEVEKYFSLAGNYVIKEEIALKCPTTQLMASIMLYLCMKKPVLSFSLATSYVICIDFDHIYLLG